MWYHTTISVPFRLKRIVPKSVAILDKMKFNHLYKKKWICLIIQMISNLKLMKSLIKKLPSPKDRKRLWKIFKYLTIKRQVSSYLKTTLKHLQILNNLLYVNRMNNRMGSSLMIRIQQKIVVLIL
jgi:hypothetical protein